MSALQGAVLHSGLPLSAPAPHSSFMPGCLAVCVRYVRANVVLSLTLGVLCNLHLTVGSELGAEKELFSEDYLAMDTGKGSLWLSGREWALFTVLSFCNQLYFPNQFPK